MDHYRDDAIFQDDYFDNSTESYLDDYFDPEEDEFVEDEELDDNDKLTEMFKSVTKNKNYYCPPEELMHEFELSVINQEPTPKFIQFIILIAEGSSVLVKRINNELDRQSCINYAVSIVWKDKWKRYEQERSENIFAFFTKVLVNDMKTYINYITEAKRRSKFISFETLYLE